MGSDFSQEERASIPVGKVQHLRHIRGVCVGGDVTWKGSEVLRLVALQAAGCGGDLTTCGRRWASCLSELEADVGVVAESRIRNEGQHLRVVDGFLQGGYIAVSHNVTADEDLRASDVTHGPQAAGVIIAVRRSYVGEWTKVEKDLAGRAVAGNLVMADGTTLRIVGVYGPTGAWHRSFESSATRVRDERALVQFVLK